MDPLRPPNLRTCRPRPLVYGGQQSKTQHRTNQVPSFSYFRFHLGSLAGALVGAGALGNGSDRCARTDRRLRMIYTGAIWCRMHNPSDCLCRSELSNEHGPETPASIRRRAAETIDPLPRILSVASLWEQQRLGIKPRRSWKEAVVRWVAETSEKVTHQEDMRKLRSPDPLLGTSMLDEITLDVIDAIKAEKLTAAGKPTINRYLALVRAILLCARDEWEWIDKTPK